MFVLQVSIFLFPIIKILTHFNMFTKKIDVILNSGFSISARDL